MFFNIENMREAVFIFAGDLIFLVFDILHLIWDLIFLQVDTMIIQAIGLLDDLDKELNTYAMRVREWYGWHFPELAKIVQDNILYAKTVKLMGNRVNAAKLDFSEVKLFY